MTCCVCDADKPDANFPAECGEAQGCIVIVAETKQTPAVAICADCTRLVNATWARLSRKRLTA